MAKVNSIGVKAGDVDRIIDAAILRIETGEDVYSCCAFMLAGTKDYLDGWKVRKAYTRTFGPVTSYIDNFGYAFSTEVNRATHNNSSKAKDFRVLMLSLFRAAWRDLV